MSEIVDSLPNEIGSIPDPIDDQLAQRLQGVAADIEQALADFVTEVGSHIDTLQAGAESRLLQIIEDAELDLQTAATEPLGS